MLDTSTMEDVERIAEVWNTGEEDENDGWLERHIMQPMIFQHTTACSGRSFSFAAQMVRAVGEAAVLPFTEGDILDAMPRTVGEGLLGCKARKHHLRNGWEREADVAQK
jgi:hypothetical protein